MIKTNISVVVPVYGVEKYIERFARSLFNQSMTNNVEFVFIDDCSVDNSIPILKKVINEYPHLKEQIRIERLPKNMGLLGARLAGLNLAKGDYIICLDSDDWIEPTMLEDMYKKATSDNCDVVISDYYEDTPTKQKLRVQRPDNLEGQKCMNQILSKGLHGSWCNKMFKRNLIANKKIMKPEKGMNVLEDLMMTAQMMYFSKKIGYINKSYYHYCIRPGSTFYSANKNNFKSILYAYDFIEKFYKENNIQSKSSKNALRIFRITTLSIVALDGYQFKIINFNNYKHLRPYIMKHPGLTRSYKLTLWLRVSGLKSMANTLIFIRKHTKKV